ncbi:hypothetical protein AB0M47_11580 [Hamadaea sp. NPDC051192]|uniref:hypothetical protein n=1 Tax=Hamadaea sp. NPDC051192 TaxID=3154940 RepID=UPI00342F37AB
MRRVLSVLGTIALLIAGPLPSRATGEPVQAAADATATRLPTGDRVTMVGGAPVVDPGPGRDKVPFVTRVAGGRVRVAAADALDSPATFTLPGAKAAASKLTATATATYQVTFVHIGFDGQPATDYQTALLSEDFSTYYDVTSRGPATIEVPAGAYLLDGIVTNGDRTALKAAELVQPRLEVTGDTTVVLDARTAKPSSLTVPDATAGLVMASAHYTFTNAAGLMTEGGLFTGSWDSLYTAQLGDDVAGFASSISGQWRTSSGHDVYAVRYNQDGHLISGYQRAVQPAELATVTTTFAGGNDPAMTADWYAVSRLPGQETHAAAVAYAAPVPGTIVRHFNGDGPTQWRTRVYESWGECFGCTVTTGAWTAYRGGSASTETFNGAVASPSLPGPEVTLHSGVIRSGDTITVDLPMYADGAGHPGDSGENGSTVLYRDGVEAGREEWGGYGSFTVPAVDSRYRLVAQSTRGIPYALSSDITATWEFRSAYAPSRVLPLWAIRFAPRLDEQNTATSRDLLMPVQVTPAPGARVGALREATVEVSVDDGLSWIRVPYAAGLALVRHPAGHGYVSLRGSVRDSDGNTAALTVIRAYRY